MKLIVGLGNPEEKYFSTRHNVGFLAVDRVRERFLYQKNFDVSEWKKERMFNAQLSFIRFNSKILALFIKPLTYMNCSGEAVAKIIKKYEIDNLHENLVLLYDDLDIEFGKFKIQVGKAPKSHNGVNNVISMIKSDDFKNVRIGIESRDGRQIKGEDFVLMKFTKDERLVLDEVLDGVAKSLISEILL